MADLKKTGLVFKAEGQAEFVRSLKEINAELKQNDYEMDRAAATWDKSTKTKEKLTRRLEHLTSNYQLLDQRLRLHKEELKELENDENASSEAIANKKKQIAYVEREMARYEDRIKGVNKRLESSFLGMEDFGKSLQNVGGSLKDTGKKLSIASAAVGGIGAMAAKTGIEFEKSMSEVAAASGATGKELDQLTEAARRAGRDTDKSASQAADALKYMSMAGWDVKTSQEALMPILKLSSGANMELGATADMVIANMATLGLEIDDLEHYLDVMAQTARSSKTDVGDLGEAFKVVGGRLRGLKVPVEEGAAALGVLANNGIEGSEAGRGLNAVLTNLTAPTGRAKKALDELGVSAFDSNGEFIGIEATLREVENAMADMDDEQQNAYRSMIGGKEHSKTLEALLKGLDGGFDNLSGSIANASGAMEDMYKVSTDNTMGSINELKSQFEDLQITIFNNLKPAIDWMTEKLKGLVSWFNGLSEEGQQLVTTIGLIVAVAGPLLFIIGSFIEKIGIIIEKFAILAPKVIAAAKAVAGFFGISVGWLVAIVAAVVILGIIIYKNWETIRERTFELLDKMKEGWNNFKEWISNLWNNIKEFFINIWTGIKEWFIELWESVFQPIVDIFMKILNFYKNIGLLLISLFAMGLEAIWNFFEPFVTKIIEWVKVLSTTIIEIFSRVRDILVNIINRIRDTWKVAMDFVKDKVMRPLVDFFSGIFDRIWSIVKGVIDRMRNAFTVMGDAVKTVFRGIRDTVVNIFSAIAGIIKAPINGVISAINGALKGMNKIKVPKWVPGVGGKGINFSMIPMLAKGGNLLGGSAIVGEAGPELLQSSGGRTTVTPLSDGGGAVPREIIDYDRLAQANVRAFMQMFASMEVKLDERQVGQFVRKTMKGAY